MPLVDDVGCWAEQYTFVPADAPARPALFLDRDGVVIEEKGFLHSASGVELIEGAAETISAFSEASWFVILVTNQSGIARGHYRWGAFEAVHRELERQLAVRGARLDAAYACGYHRDGQGSLAVSDHAWRKPRPGMLLAASRALPVLLEESWMVGDRSSDVAAAKAAGLVGGIQVRTGHATPEHEAASQALATPSFRVQSAGDITAARDLLDHTTREQLCLLTKSTVCGSWSWAT